MENSDFDRVLGRGGEAASVPVQPECQSRRGGKPTAGERSLRDRANECLHRDVLLLTPQTGKSVRVAAIASCMPRGQPE